MKGVVYERHPQLAVGNSAVEPSASVVTGCAHWICCCMDADRHFYFMVKGKYMDITFKGREPKDRRLDIIIVLMVIEVIIQIITLTRGWICH
jgi:hypothetical protein